jgi:hypothetical protein
MPHSTKHSKTQPHDHGRDPEGRRRGIEEGGRETMNEVLDDGTLRGIGDNEENVPQYDHRSKGGGRASGGESEQRRRGLEVGGGVSLNRSLEDGQLRGVDEDGQIIQGMHGGPRGNVQGATTRRKA